MPRKKIPQNRSKRWIKKKLINRWSNPSKKPVRKWNSSQWKSRSTMLLCPVWMRLRAPSWSSMPISKKLSGSMKLDSNSSSTCNGKRRNYSMTSIKQSMRFIKRQVLETSSLRRRSKPYKRALKLKMPRSISYYQLPKLILKLWVLSRVPLRR